MRSSSVKPWTVGEGRVWLRSPCVSIANWECPPGLLGVPWLLIQVRLVVPLDASARYPRVAYINTGPSTVRGSVISKGLGWMDIGQDPPLGLWAGRRHEQVLSVKVANDQAEITAAIGRVSAVADELVLAVDILGTPSALLAPLGGARQSVYYASRRVVATRAGPTRAGRDRHQGPLRHG